MGIKHWVGIEPSIRNFEVAKRTNPEPDVYNKGLEGFDIDEKFDCAICIMVFSHIRDVDHAFKRLHDILNPNGRLIIVLSAFHEIQDRYERHGRKYEVVNIDKDQYVDRAMGGYCIADINRRPEFYIEHAKVCRFSLEHQGKINDIGYSPKDLLVFSHSDFA